MIQNDIDDDSSSDYNDIVESLSEQSFAVIPNFLSSQASDSILNHINQLLDDDEFKKAGIGKQINYDINRQLRGDFISWINKEIEPGEVKLFLNRIENLVKLLNRTCFLSIKDYETHYTFYPTETRYIRHKDRFQKNAHRLISFVCYLAPDWTLEDGGQLRLYIGDQTKDILPQQGMLVCFKSELEHEVLLTHRSRYSITGWMLDQPAQLTFL